MPREMVAAERSSLNAEAIALQDAVARLRFTISYGHIPPAAMDKLYEAFAAFTLHAEALMTDVDPNDLRAVAGAATDGFLGRLDRVFDPPADDDRSGELPDGLTPDGASWAP